MYFAAKLDGIRAKVNPLTTRKVELISGQLERKYELLSLGGSSPAANLLKVTRWYRQQPAEMRAALDDAEPTTWMKHLINIRTPPMASRENIPFLPILSTPIIATHTADFDVHRLDASW